MRGGGARSQDVRGGVMPRPNDVGVGVSVIIVCQGHVLMGQRKGAHGAGQWSLPGGWVDRADASIESAAIREVREETGLIIAETARLCETMVDYPDHGFASVTLFRVATKQLAVLPEVEVREPNKCAGWRWFMLDNLPSLLFGGVAEALDVFKARGHEHSLLQEITRRVDASREDGDFLFWLRTKLSKCCLEVSREK